jgi:micrococcal nuclease
MIKKLLYFTPTMALILIYFFQPIHPENPEQTVVRVLDGDTLELENGERIRLLGIDAPELGEPFFEEAKLALEGMVLNKVVKIEKDSSLDKDKYGRSLGYVFLYDKLVNCEMVRLGLAKSIVQEEFKYYYCLQLAEQEAREKKIGIWSSA